MRQHHSMLRGTTLLLLLTAAASDPCADIQSAVNADQPVRPSQISSCLDSFPFSPDIASATLDTVTKALGAYVFLGATNIMPALAGMVNRTFPTERAFHDTVRAEFVATGDAHLKYESDCFHTPYTASLALPLTAMEYSSGMSKVVVVQYPDESSPVWPGVNLTKYAGARVSQINGLNAFKMLKLFATNPPDYAARDWGVRFNLALAHHTFIVPSGLSESYPSDDLGAFSLRLGSIPSADTVTLTLRRKGSTKREVVSVPWSVRYNGPAFGTTAEQYYAANCALPPVPQSGVNAQGRQVLSVPRRPRDARRRLARRRMAVSATPLVTGILQAYLLPDGVTGVIVVPTFEMTPQVFVPAMKECITALQGYNATRLILDMRGNTNGKVPAGLHFVNILFPGVGNPSPRFVFAGSPYVQGLVLSSLQTFSSAFCSTSPGCRYWFGTWLDDSFHSMFKAYEFFFPVTTTVVPTTLKTRKGRPALTSIPVSRPFRQRFNPQTAAEDLPPFQASKVIVLSDGSCQSTCAMAVHILRWRMGVKVAFVGGVSAVNPDINSAVTNAAGAVLRLDELFSDELIPLEELGQDNHPMPLPVLAQLRMPIRAALIQRSTPEPSKTNVDAFEFLPVPPHFRIYNTWDVLQGVEGAWTRTAAFFS